MFADACEDSEERKDQIANVAAGERMVKLAES